MTKTYTKPALFLDRDGVINVEKNYVHRIEDFEFVDGIFDLCRLATRLGLVLVVVTNQAGIGRGFYTEAQFHALTAWMSERFAAEGAPLAAVYFCPFHPEHGVGDYKRESFERKPNPGMMLRARDELGLDLSRSLLLGDKHSDIVAAKAAGVGVTLLLGEDANDARPTVAIYSLAEACSVLDQHYLKGQHDDVF
ncbi:D-glycero-alpha-D-manno-heptose-1,7-bisphosphate 7-phosphatase [Methylomonas sp. BW4-1]|uniref:D-glycero-alpha-D-manno-heptose-1,7-bisphosphate 7-phosphatase n=1 Tax=Methylomonas sp. BW4-1 TaxID=3376685 RepID=UPI004042D309